MTGVVVDGLTGVAAAAGLATLTTASGTAEPAAAREATPAAWEPSAGKLPTPGPAAGGSGPATVRLRDHDLIALRQTRRDPGLTTRRNTDLHGRLDGLAVLDLLDVDATGRVAMQGRRGHDQAGDPACRSARR
jgi:hypothetical protein